MDDTRSTWPGGQEDPRRWIDRGPMSVTPGAHVWDSLDGYRVISSIDVTERGTEWHISISYNGALPRTEPARRVLADFGADWFEEDSHYPCGIARHFWMPTAEDMRGDCLCRSR